MISYEQWQVVEGWARQEPGLFHFGDQGILNYLVHAKSQRGEIKSTWSDLQWSRSSPRDSLEKDCARAGWRFPEQVGKPMVLHFCGSKPHITNFKGYSRPFTIARLAHYRRGHGSLGAWIAIWIEEMGLCYNRIKGRFSRKMA